MKNKKKSLELQSMSDIITNSSSEVFIIEAQGETVDSLKKKLESALKNDVDRCSGMGGELDVYDSKTQNPENEDFCDEEEKCPYAWLPDGFFAIDFDWGFEGLKKYMKENFRLVDCPDRRCLIDKDSEEFAGYYESDYDKSKYRDVPGGKFESEEQVKYYTKMIEKSERDIQVMADEMGFSTEDAKKKLNELHNLMCWKTVYETNLKYANLSLKHLKNEYQRSKSK